MPLILLLIRHAITLLLDIIAADAAATPAIAFAPMLSPFRSHY